MEPVGRVVVRGRDEVGDAHLGSAPRAGQHREQPGLAGGDAAARFLPWMWATPVERLVRPVTDRRERDEPPADDPVCDLESTADLDGSGRAIGERDRVPGEPLAGRQDPAHGCFGRSLPRGIAPAVREVGHHEVAGSALTPEVDRQLVIEEQPAPSRSPSSELEREAPEHDGAVGQPRQGGPVRGIEPFAQFGIGRVPRRRQVHRTRQRRRDAASPDGHGCDPPDRY